MSAADTRLDRLVAIEEIKALKARYFRCIDHKDWDGFAGVFSSDCVLEVPEAALTLRGPTEIVASVSAALANARSVHHGHMPEIEVTGPDTARGVWAMEDYVEWPSADGDARVGIRGYGHYVETYVRDDGAWRIASSRLDRLRVDSLGAIPSGDLTDRS
ncbi:MAG TPA: nuclear transport factor 2 family protein [Mycobacteriales bacterium]|nr:nuclear transport factor 2 family protein [Mycobacteriales bacterium]